MGNDRQGQYYWSYTVEVRFHRQLWSTIEDLFICIDRATAGPLHRWPLPDVLPEVPIIFYRSKKNKRRSLARRNNPTLAPLVSSIFGGFIFSQILLRLNIINSYLGLAPGDSIVDHPPWFFTQHRHRHALPHLLDPNPKPGLLFVGNKMFMTYNRFDLYSYSILSPDAILPTHSRIITSIIFSSDYYSQFWYGLFTLPSSSLPGYQPNQFTPLKAVHTAASTPINLESAKMSSKK
jgi:hypothetical protein